MNRLRIGFGKARACALGLAFGVLATAFGAQADMPARNIEYADIDAVQALVLAYFGPCQASGFAAALARTRDDGCMARADSTRHRCLGSDNALQRELARLIDESGRAKAAGIEEFLERINQGKLLRGHLIARNGGDYETVMSLEVEADSGRRYLVARHRFGDGRIATWRCPLAGR